MASLPHYDSAVQLQNTVRAVFERWSVSHQEMADVPVPS